MDALIRDVWHDLREKRLWPVAVLLLAGLVAVPLLLMKPSEPPTPPPAAGAVAPGEAPELASIAALGIESTGGGEGRGSSLGSFEPRNPFKPAASVLSAGDSAVEPLSEVASTSSATPPSAGVSTGTDIGSDTGSSFSGGAPDLTVGGGSPGGPVGGAPAPAPAPQPAPRDAPDAEPQRMTYAVDVSFTGPEQTREVRGLPRLAALPHASVPLLIFLGVSDGGEEAVFLVDSKLDAIDDVEGTCRPSADNCATLELKPGERQIFVDAEGRRYGLQLDQIREVSVERAARSRRARDAQAADAGREPQRFLPVLVDVLIGG